MRVAVCKDEENTELFLTKSEYRNNGRIYLGFECYDGDSGYNNYQPYGDLTINLSDFMIEDDNIIFINSYVSDSIIEQLEDIGLLTQLDVVQYNMGRYRKCYLFTKTMENFL